MAKKYRS